MAYQQPASVPEGARYTAQTSTTMYGQALPQAHGHTQSRPSQNTQGDVAMAAMMSSFSHTHLGVPTGVVAPPTNALQVDTSQFSVNSSQFFYTQDGRIMFAPAPNIYPGQQIAATQMSDATYGTYPTALSYIPQATYPGYLPGYTVMPYTPARPGYYSDRSDIVHKEVPGLENRRGSYSTNESAPGTPYYGSMGQRDQGTHVSVVDRSPIYSTPSPQQLPSHSIPQVGKPLPYKNIALSFDIDTLVQQHPAIPHAVPAVFTPRESMRTLEQSVSNPIYGNRNVYIRGLHPNTDDETLAAYAARFGRIETSKAIIDTSTGACKGFGFAKYFDVRDSEMCIRGFYKLGYEVGFARESFNSRLKAEGDDNSTNLYVSNLPKSMTETELGAIFMDYTVVSSRILRDTQGNSRGVGFARFETRDLCEEIIKVFHGQPIGEEGLLLQVRYADTPAQKDLKRVTTERRQFRTNEYNVGAYGGVGDIISLSPPMPSPVLPRMTQIARHLPQPRIDGSWKRDASNTTNTSVCGVSFKDIGTKGIKDSLGQGSSAGKSKPLPTVSTPSVSEDGSVDEGATIQCLSPAVANGATSSPVAQKTD